jgi:hypothetical protein
MAKGKQGANLKKLAGELALVTPATEQVPPSISFMGRVLPVEIANLTELDGQWVGQELKIELRPGLKPVEQRDTVVHELFHAIDQFLVLGMSERQVRLLATALVGIFQDNPEFAAYVTENFKDTNTKAASE